jgi:hypothetical protein
LLLLQPARFSQALDVVAKGFDHRAFLLTRYRDVTKLLWVSMGGASPMRCDSSTRSALRGAEPGSRLARSATAQPLRP